jgi:phospholipase C
MGYHDSADIPNYWTYAHDFVLQDHMYEPNRSWSLPQHLFLVSEWAAVCSDPSDPSSCRNEIEKDVKPNGQPLYAWTDITYLLHRAGVSWGYYVFKGTEPDCEQDTQMTCSPTPQAAKTPGIWNPLPSFTDVAADSQKSNVKSLSAFFSAAKAGTLPAVSWIVPNGTVSEHPTALVSAGQTYVTGLINTIMQSPEWNSTAIFLSWDDWGGFFDQSVPPAVDQNGYGLRVPGMVISPYAKSGYIDHQTLSQDAYNKFIEDDFLSSQRLDPSTDGRPDPRRDVREAATQLGNLMSDFDFSVQQPRQPVLLPVCPSTDLRPKPTC